METIILVIHLILALILIGIVLIQRSEGGGLGIGGGGGSMSGRPPASPLAKVTWFFAIAFVITSMVLTILAARNANSDSVIERLGTGDAQSEDQSVPSSGGLDGNLLPPDPSNETAEPPQSE